MNVLKTLSRRYLENPQLITPDSFKQIAEILDLKEGKAGLQEFFKPMSKESRIKEKMLDPFYSGYKFSSEGDVESSPEAYGVIKVEGPLSYKPIVQMCAPDLTNYQELLKQAELLISEGKKKLIIIHDSPGGEAYMMMETARNLRELADRNQVELVGYVDGLSASASYGLLSVCHKIIANPDASVGSIGVVIAINNSSEALKKAGIKRHYITAGASKVPFSEDGEFKEEFIKDLQEDVDALYENFTAHVSNFRETMTIKDVKNTEAKVFRAEEALRLGLIDEIMEVAEFKEKHLDSSEESIISTNVNKNKGKESMSKDTPQTNASEDVAIQLAEMQKLLEAQNKQLEAYQKKEQASQRQELDVQLSSFSFLGDSKEPLLNVLMSADTPEDTKELFTNIVDKANTEVESVKEELNSTIKNLECSLEEAKQEAEEAKLSADKVKKEFGSKQSSVEGSPEIETSSNEGVARTSQLADFVKHKLASKQ